MRRIATRVNRAASPGLQVIPGGAGRAENPLNGDSRDERTIAAADSSEVQNQNEDAAWLGRGSATMAAGMVCGRGFFLVGQAVLARTLGPAGFGLYSIGWTLLRLGGLVSPLGLDAAAIHFTSKSLLGGTSERDRLRGVLRGSLLLAIGSGMLTGVAMYCLSPQLARLFGKPDLDAIVAAFAPAFALCVGLRVASGATKVSQSMRYSVYSEWLCQPLVQLALIVLFYALGWGVLGAIRAAVISYAVAAVLAFACLFELFPDAFLRGQPIVWSNRELLKFSVPVMVGTALTSLIIWTDRLLVPYFLSSHETGIYNASVQISVAFDLVLSSFSAALAARITSIHQRKEWDRLGELFKLGTKWPSYLCIPLFLAIWFDPTSLMKLIYGNQYAGDGAVVLVLLSAGQMANVMSGPVGYLLVYTEQRKLLVAASILSITTATALNWVLIPRLGLYGAGLATCIVHCVVAVGYVIAVGKVLGIWPYDWRWLKGVGATGVTAVALWIVTPAARTHGSLGFLAIVFVAYSAFALTLVVLGLDREDAYLLKAVGVKVNIREGKPKPAATLP